MFYKMIGKYRLTVSYEPFWGYINGPLSVVTAFFENEAVDIFREYADHSRVFKQFKDEFEVWNFIEPKVYPINSERPELRPAEIPKRRRRRYRNS